MIKQPKSKIRDVKHWFGLTDLPIEVTHWLGEKLARSKPEDLALSAKFPSQRSEKKSANYTSFIQLNANGDGKIKLGKNSDEQTIDVTEAWKLVRNHLWSLNFGYGSVINKQKKMAA